ncbi:hypothetical protein GCM10027425_26220 [Alteromonas gracilis]
MTAALDLAPTGSGLATLVTQVHELLDLAPESAVGDAGMVIREIDRAQSRLAALRLRVLGSAESARAAAAAGASDAGSWSARLTRTEPAKAHRDMRLARELRGRSATRSALARGVITPEHAAVITRADADLPARVTPEERRTVEESLVEKAQTLNPAQLRRHAKRALAAIEPDETIVDAHEDDLLRAEEDRARAKTRLTLHDNGDGTVTGHFTIPTLAAAMLTKILHALTAPRRAALGASHAQVGHSDERRDADRARGLAFVEILTHLPQDGLTKTAATLVVHVDDAVMRGALKAAGLETDQTISSGEARRLACGAGILPAVLVGRSQPLDLGTTKRLFSEAQRIAISKHHTHCGAEGCERPFAWCELHHLIPWSRGGPTDLANAVPLCHFHHRRIHDPRYRHERGPDGIRFRELRGVPRGAP